MAQVLIVEDERDLAKLIEFNLQQAGHAVRVANSGDEGLAMVRERVPELVVLDVMLPDLSGLEVCRAIKANPKTKAAAVLLLTAKGEEEQRVEGFEAGADDYVTKPFSVRELVLRIQAVLRRTGPAAAAAAPTGELKTVGVLRLDIAAHRCFVEEEEIPLTLLEFRLLHHLMSRLGRVQSREQLLEDVWELSSQLETRTVDTHVMRLREKLGAARAYIETVRGIGYRMVAPTEEGRVTRMSHTPR